MRLGVYFALVFFSTLFLEADGQLVTEKFDKLSLSENFDSTTSYWTTLANADNLFIVQEGEYILNRKTTANNRKYGILNSNNNCKMICFS